MTSASPVPAATEGLTPYWNEIARFYGINRRTLYNWRKSKGLLMTGRRRLTPFELAQVFEAFGRPQDWVALVPPA